MGNNKTAQLINDGPISLAVSWMLVMLLILVTLNLGQSARIGSNNPPEPSEQRHNGRRENLIGRERTRDTQTPSDNNNSRPSEQRHESSQANSGTVMRGKISYPIERALELDRKRANAIARGESNGRRGNPMGGQQFNDTPNSRSDNNNPIPGEQRHGTVMRGKISYSIERASELDRRRADAIAKIESGGRRADYARGEANSQRAEPRAYQDLEKSAIRSDREYEELLAKLRQETQESVHNPENYLSDDMDLSHILELVEAAEEKCPICYETMNSYERTGFKTCRHKFHAECLKAYLTSGQARKNCPCCRQEFRTDDIEGPSITREWKRGV